MNEDLAEWRILMKRLAFCALMLLLILGLTGCLGKEKSIDINDVTGSTMLARTNGEIQVATVEKFNKDYYDLSELKDYINKEIDAYNKKAGNGKIVVNKVEEKKEKAIMLLTYSGMGQYAAFNEEETAYFSGGPDKKLPFTLPTTLVNAENKDLTSTQDVITNEKYKILIVTEPYHVIVDGKVKYYSENVEFTDSNEVNSTGDGMSIIVFEP
jgi:hypothetical protein